jgi:hypothetical protein
MTWNARVRRIFNVTVCLAITFVLSGQSRATAATVLLLSTGFADSDTAIKSGLERLGHQVDIGPQYVTFDGTNLSNYDVVILVPSYNYGSGDMPVAGQSALKDFVSSGKGLVTGEWTLWEEAAFGSFLTLDEAIPVVATVNSGGASPITYSVDTPDNVLNAGVDLAFTFVADIVSGSETSFVAKDGATIFYDSDYQDGASGVIGWNFNSGRVISFSTVMGPVELGDPNYSQLLSNAVTWTVTPR